MQTSEDRIFRISQPLFAILQILKCFFQIWGQISPFLPRLKFSRLFFLEKNKLFILALRVHYWSQTTVTEGKDWVE